MPPGGNNDGSGTAGAPGATGIGAEVGGPTPVSVFTSSTENAIPASETKDKPLSRNAFISDPPARPRDGSAVVRTIPAAQPPHGAAEPLRG